MRYSRQRTERQIRYLVPGAASRPNVERDVIDADLSFHKAIMQFAQSPLLERVFREYDIHPISSVVDGRSIDQVR